MAEYNRRMTDAQELAGIESGHQTTGSVNNQSFTILYKWGSLPAATCPAFYITRKVT